MTKRTTIFIVDDHPLFRSGVRRAFHQHENFLIAGEADSGADALARISRLKPDLVIMDIHLPDMSGIEVTRKIQADFPDIKVLILSADFDKSLVDAAIEAGASGYLVKGSVVDELLQAIDEISSGKLYACREASEVIFSFYRGTRSRKSTSALSDKEKLMLRLIAEGRRNKEMADDLGLSPNSVETFRARVMKKTGCKSTADLIRYAIREGLISA